MTNFNKHFQVPDVTEHLDIPLENDLEAFIDPYLIANNLDKALAKRLYVRSKAFLEILNRGYILPNNRRDGINFLSHLTEANEYHLGYSDKNQGKGIGLTKAAAIFSSLRANKFARTGLSVTNEAHNVLLLVKGIGQDNMSDTLANICRDILADFTFNQCIKYSIPVREFDVEYFNQTTRKWEKTKRKLPFYNWQKIILTPQFLVSGSRIYPNHYNWFISSNCISSDIINGRIKVVNQGDYLYELKNGEKRAHVKNINRDFRKPKDKLVDFVLTYQDSLLDFQDYVKENYPSINLPDINKAS